MPSLIHSVSFSEERGSRAGEEPRGRGARHDRSMARMVTATVCIDAVVLGRLIGRLVGGAINVGGAIRVAIGGMLLLCVGVQGGVVLGGAGETGDGDVGGGGGMSLLLLHGGWLVEQLLVLIIAVGVLKEVPLVGGRGPALLPRLAWLELQLECKGVKCL